MRTKKMTNLELTKNTLEFAIELLVLPKDRKLAFKAIGIAREALARELGVSPRLPRHTVLLANPERVALEAMAAVLDPRNDQGG
jgi:hypothetical protein